MYHIEGGCVAPTDVNLVEGPGRIYDSAIYKFHNVLAHHIPNWPRVLDYTYVFQEILNDTRAVLYAYGL